MSDIAKLESDLYKSLLSSPTLSLSWAKPSAWTGHIPFASWLIKMLKPKVFVELGSHWGVSYFGFCHAVQSEDISTKCFAIDSWSGDQHAGFYPEEIFLEVSSYNEQKFNSFSTLLRMDFDVALESFSNSSIDLLHIDGLHTYEAVKHDFETWLPKLAPGALVLFHDTNVREKDFGVWKFFDEVKLKYPNNIEFIHSHGLGVIQINCNSDLKLNWLSNEFSEKKILINYFRELGTELEEKYRSYEIIAQRDLTITTLYNEIAKKDSEIHESGVTIYERGAILAARDEKIAELNREISLRDGYISERNLVIATRQSELEAVLNSTSWKISKPIRLLGSFLGKYR